VVKEETGQRDFLITLSVINELFHYLGKFSLGKALEQSGRFRYLDNIAGTTASR
jgi:hypothetical protein